MESHLGQSLSVLGPCVPLKLHALWGLGPKCFSKGSGPRRTGGNHGPPPPTAGATQPAGVAASPLGTPAIWRRPGLGLGSSSLLREHAPSPPPRTPPSSPHSHSIPARGIL